MDVFNGLAVKRSIIKLFESSYFCILDFDEIADLMGVIPDHRIRRQLRAYHCVKYADLSAAETNLLQEKVVEALRGDRAINPARMLSAITDEGNDFTFTEDREVPHLN